MTTRDPLTTAIQAAVRDAVRDALRENNIIPAPVQVPAPDAGERMLTTAEAAEYTGIAEHTLRRWRSEGRGPRYHRLGRFIRYTRADITAWAQATPAA